MTKKNPKNLIPDQLHHL